MLLPKSTEGLLVAPAERTSTHSRLSSRRAAQAAKGHSEPVLSQLSATDAAPVRLVSVLGKCGERFEPEP